MATDYRQQAFKTKFQSAAAHLGVTPYQIVSLKLRDVVSSYSDYHDMLDGLEREVGVQSTPIKDDLQGKGYLVGKDKQKVIVVEHETGLEILYIAGSVASLIGLVPLVLQSWHAIRGFMGRRHHSHISGVEIRRLDSQGKLQEEHDHSFPLSFSSPLALPHSALLSASRVLEKEFESLRKQVESHSARIAALEKARTPRRASTKRQAKRGSSKA
jgi:hypothetical protein